MATLDSDHSARDRRLAAFAIAGAVVSVSLAAPLFRLAEVGPVAASAWRLLLATLLLLPFTNLKELRGVNLGPQLLAGAFLALHFGAWVTSLEYTSVAASVSLVTLQALLAAILAAIFLKERLTPRIVGGILLATSAGIVLVFYGGAGATVAAPNPILGNALALVGAVGSAVYLVVGRKSRQSLSTLAFVVPVYGSAGLLLAIASPLLGQSLALPSTAAVWNVVLLAIVPMIGGHTLANYSLRVFRPSTVSTWILLEPIGASLVAFFLFVEVPNGITILCGIATLLGAFIASTTPRKRLSNPVAPVS